MDLIKNSDKYNNHKCAYISLNQCIIFKLIFLIEVTFEETNDIKCKKYFF